jgi:hypothetical protein
MKKILFLLFFAGGLYQVNAATTINQVRWGSSGDPLNGLTVTWSNTGTADSIQWGYTTSYEKGKFPAVKRAGYTSGTSFFKYVFPTVTATTTLYYSFYDSKGKTWNPPATFMTSPPVNTSSFSFCALGDCRDYPSTLTTVSNLVTARKSSLVLFNGDLTLLGTSASEYNTFFTAASAFLANNLVYHVMGNHDNSNSSMFSNLWDLPQTGGTNLYYSFRYGNAIFISLNSNDAGNATQLTWLQNTLSAAASDPSITWKIVSFHHAFFNTGSHTGDMDSYRSTWWKAFDDYGVDMVFNGHDHNYQRTYPINLNAGSVGTPVAKYGSTSTEGRCQVISGGAGAGLYSQNTGSSDAWSINVFNKTYNYTSVTVTGCKVKIIAYDQNNVLIDSLTLDKSGTSACVATGVQELKQVKSNPISITPNPLEGSFTMHYDSEQTGEATIKIYDVAGKVVISEKVIKSTNNLEYHYDLSGHAKGMYSISVIMGNRKESATMILK